MTSFPFDADNTVSIYRAYFIGDDYNFTQYYQRDGVKYLKNSVGDRIKMYWLDDQLIIEPINFKFKL